MKNTWPPRNYDSVDGQAGQILADQSLTASDVGKVDAAAVELDVSGLKGAICAINYSLTNADFTTGDEEYLLFVEQSNDDFVTSVRANQIVLNAAAGTDTIAEGSHMDIVHIVGQKLRVNFALSGTTPSVDMKAWISQVDSP